MSNHLPPPDTAPASEQPAPAPPTEPPATPTAAAKRTITPLVAGAIGLVLGATIVGGTWAITAAVGPGEPDTFTLTGKFQLTDEVLSVDNDTCRGRADSGYQDIAEGTSVTVYGAKGDVVATGNLGDSKPDDSGLTCTFKVAVEDVPKGETFYKVEVSHRGTVQLSAKEAENGELAASLG